MFFTILSIRLYGVYNDVYYSSEEDRYANKSYKNDSQIKKAGFVEVPKNGGHRKFVHPDGRMTEVPMHSKELTPYTERMIYKQTGIK